MIWINPEQLYITLQKETKSVYVLFGDDLCILKDSCDKIIQSAKISNFYECINVDIDIHYNWNYIFNMCKIPDLFQRRKILLLKFAQNYPIKNFYKNITLLYSCLDADILLILCIYASCDLTQDNICVQPLNKTGTFVICMTPQHAQLTKWVMSQTQQMQLFIEKKACQLLCYYYKNNLILLKQILHISSLIYSDKNLSFIRIKKIATDSAYFDTNHWIEAILIGNAQHANRILRQLENMDISLEILLKKIQHEIFILIDVQHKLTSKNSLHILLKQYKIYEQYRYLLLYNAIKRLHMKQLYQSLAVLVQIELNHKKEYSYISRTNFELLAKILS